MADHDKPNQDASKKRKKSNLPEGRRVVRKKRRRSSGNRETMVLSNREILGKMIDEESERPLDVRGQVDRLRKAQKEQKKNADPPMEEKWGAREHRRKGSQWLPVAILLIVVPLLIFVVVSGLNRSTSKSEEVRGGDRLNLDEDDVIKNPFVPTDPVGWFHENSVKAYEECVSILNKINETDDALETASLMRNPEETAERMQKENFQWEESFKVSDPRSISWEFGSSGDVGYMIIMGKDSAFNPFRAYFVKTNDGVKMDWEATTGWSEVSIDKLVVTDPVQPVFVRGWIVKKPHFDSDSNKLISWYQILNPNKSEFVWVYTPSESEIDVELKGMLNYGTVVMDLIEEERVIARLKSGSPGRRDNEFELVEFVAKDWVQP